MERRYNVTGERRKEMVEAISGIVGMKAVYMRMPTCAYAISNFTVSKEGTLVWDERSSGELVERVLAGLAQAGFMAEPTEAVQESGTAEESAEPENHAEEPETAPQGALQTMVQQTEAQSTQWTAQPEGQAMVSSTEQQAVVQQRADEQADLWEGEPILRYGENKYPITQRELNWRYIDGMYRRFEQRDITTGAEAYQYDLLR